LLRNTTALESILGPDAISMFQLSQHAGISLASKKLCREIPAASVSSAPGALRTMFPAALPLEVCFRNPAKSRGRSGASCGICERRLIVGAQVLISRLCNPWCKSRFPTKPPSVAKARLILRPYDTTEVVPFPNRLAPRTVTVAGASRGEAFLWAPPGRYIR
jgi:hypothetical protein